MRRREGIRDGIGVTFLGVVLLGVASGLAFGEAGAIGVGLGAILAAFGLLLAVVGTSASLRVQVLRIEGGTLTVTGREGEVSVPLRDVEQLVTRAQQISYVAKRLQSLVVHDLCAQTQDGLVSLMSGSYAEVRWVESQLEAHLAMRDDPSQNVATTRH